MLKYYCGRLGFLEKFAKNSKMPFCVFNGGLCMYKKLVSALYVLNIVSQAIFTLIIPIGLGVLVSYLLTRFTSAPSWIWAVLVVIGAMSGLYSMIKFILSAMAGLDRLEKEHNTKEKKEKSGNNDE